MTLKLRRFGTLLAAGGLVIGITACGRKHGPDDQQAQKIRQERETRQATEAKENDALKKLGEEEEDEIQASPEGWLKSVSLSPHSTAGRTVMKVDVETIKPIKGEQYVSFILWKNGQKTAEKRDNIITSEFYKKGDALVAEALFYNGPELLAKKRSDLVYIGNTAPVIENIAIPSISGPGAYQFNVTAKDHDGDKLTYSMAAEGTDKSLPQGLTIDGSTGTVTFTLTDESKPPEMLSFILTADDGDGGRAQKKISVSLTSEIIMRKEKTPSEPGNKEI